MTNAENNVVKPDITGKFIFQIPVRWGDLDALNHVNNAAYFRYFEEARVQLFSAAGLVLPNEAMIMLAHINCDFIRQVEYPETVVIELTVGKIGNTSMAHKAVMKSINDDSIIYAKSDSVIVNADPSNGKPSPWTQSVLDSFAKCFV